MIFRQKVSSILRALYDTHLTSDSSCSEAETSESEDKKRIIQAAAELILTEVKEIPRPPDGFFPSLDDISDNQCVRGYLFRRNLINFLQRATYQQIIRLSNF